MNCDRNRIITPLLGSPEPSRTETQDFYFWHTWATIQQLAEFSTERTGSHAPKQQYNIQSLFKIKHTSTKTSKKRHVNALLLIAQSGTLPVVFITQTFNCGREWLLQELTVCRDTSSRQYCAVMDSKCNRWGSPDGRYWKQHRTGATAQWN